MVPFDPQAINAFYQLPSIEDDDDSFYIKDELDLNEVLRVIS